MKTGTYGRPWVQLEQPRPPRVDDVYAYWADPPPHLSARCAYWLRQMDAGWLPPGRWRREGYDGAARLLGVWVWEYLHVIYPRVVEEEQKIDAATA